MKTCTKCKIEYELGSFHKDKSRKDGHFPWCKVCVKEDQQRFYATEKGKEAFRRKNLKQRKSMNEYLIKYNKIHAKERKARVTLLNAIRDGRMERKPCEKCGDKSEGHHPDYNQPLSVLWLCKTHHRELHKALIRK